MLASLDGTLTSPAPNSGFYSFYDSTAAADYSKPSVAAVVRYLIQIIKDQLVDDSRYIQINTNRNIELPTKVYTTGRTIPVSIKGGANNADYVYGLLSNTYAEIENITLNQGYVVQVYSRFRIDGNITDLSLIHI